MLTVGVNIQSSYLHHVCVRWGRQTQRCTKHAYRLSQYQTFFTDPYIKHFCKCWCTLYSVQCTMYIVQCTYILVTCYFDKHVCWWLTLIFLYMCVVLHWYTCAVQRWYARGNTRVPLLPSYCVDTLVSYCVDTLVSYCVDTGVSYFVDTWYACVMCWLLVHVFAFIRAHRLLRILHTSCWSIFVSLNIGLR